MWWWHQSLNLRPLMDVRPSWPHLEILSAMSGRGILGSIPLTVKTCVHLLSQMSWLLFDLEERPRRGTQRSYGGGCLSISWGQTTLQGLMGKNRSCCYNMELLSDDIRSLWIDSLFLPVIEIIIFLRFPRGIVIRQTARLFSTKKKKRHLF